ncbi:MAG: efflux RND transporter periplasmic adaptor subunit [bacterium]
MEKTRRVSKIIGVTLSLGGLVLILLWMQGILGGDKIPPGEVAYAPEGPKGPYQVDLVRRATFVNTEEAVGTVRATREVLIAPRIMGTLLELPFREGDRVESGRTVARLDDRDIRARMEQARSAVSQAQSELQRSSSDYERFMRLREQGAVPQQQFESVLAAYRAAEAKLRGAREALREAEVTLGYTAIESPISGFVVEKSMNVGDMASPGRPILTIQEAGALRLEAAVREGLAGTIQLGAPLRVGIDALNVELTGEVEEKVPAADPLTRSFLVKVALPQHPGLRSGMFGRLEIPTGSVTPLTCSRRAVRTVSSIELVWVVGGPDQAPERRYIRTGRMYGDRVEVLSGLREGESVILLPPRVLEPDGPADPGAETAGGQGS